MSGHQVEGHRQKQNTLDFAPLRRVVALVFLAMLHHPAAYSADVTFSGFMSVVGGKVLSGDATTPYAGVECPCFMSDWTTLATYNRTFSVRQESRVGVRMNAKLNDSLSGVVQVDGRGVKGSSGASLEWAYLSYAPAEDWSVQLGRKRLPIYYYSDFMDVGFAYPWVRPPQDLYGWEVSNFNGISVAHTEHVGSWSARGSVFYGREDSPDNILTSSYYPGEKIDLTWRNILGADLELSRDWFNVRMVYIQSKVDQISDLQGVMYAGAIQQIFGVSANVDYEHWLLRSEISRFDRWRDMGYRSNAAMLGVGYQIDGFTPMVTYSFFRDVSADDTPRWENESLSFTLRYDLNPTSAIKLQYDKFRELTPGATIGTANMLSVAFDKVF